MRSHEERSWSFKEPTQSRISPRILEYPKIHFECSNPTQVSVQDHADVGCGQDPGALLNSLPQGKFALIEGYLYFECLNRTMIGHGPIMVLEMARVRQNCEFSLISSVISNQ